MNGGDRAMHNREIGGRLVFLHLLRRNLLQKRAASAGLHAGQLPLLESLMAHPGCTQQELAGMLRVTPASIALSTKRLQKAGWVEKRVDEDNRRRNCLYATAEGAARATEHRRCLDTVDGEMLAGFSEVDRRTLAALLDRMIENIGEDAADGLPLPPCHWKEKN